MFLHCEALSDHKTMGTDDLATVLLDDDGHLLCGPALFATVSNERPV